MEQGTAWPKADGLPLSPYAVLDMDEPVPWAADQTPVRTRAPDFFSLDPPHDFALTDRRTCAVVPARPERTVEAMPPAPPTGFEAVLLHARAGFEVVPSEPPAGFQVVRSEPLAGGRGRVAARPGRDLRP
ncbi:hypothetical protein ACSNOI_14385 [Actinomadura kijaniata]|uniref:hypothetical protein n=1 Tax=Actinomadura kijaniata TaxID=46161 RepID=UPI003F1B2179